ncbi:hypothetical protein GCM10011344_23700 [Dokdonia pacifica]|uniref:DUF4286 domain-containing protein n=1 Tax=Dokdonia pacifica TaxID=1627892 RepID=A0A238WLA0_9FLAO|nr:DUF4286 family protein [Dokdonia pacifica]GGG22237.1 hypothetical protein GCM10011344_23700 [Dokdonia pacifica]SNR47340.1 protein of unknown function [Dokdonia pacifica]
MIIYNVTINIETAIEQEWLIWMKEEHIPDMLATGRFTKALMTKVLVEEEMGGITYSIQYTCSSASQLQAYYDQDAERLRSKSSRFTGKFVAFRTELDVISEQHV